MIVTRFAPSPTGYLHLGHAFAALTAAAAGNPFLLRLEDLDSGRARADFVSALFEDLAWLGLSWPSPVLRQSQRMAAYGAALAALEAKELVYPCFCTRAEIAREIAQAQEAPHTQVALYPGTCRRLGQAARAARRMEQPFVLRLDAAKAAAHAGPLHFVEKGEAVAVDPLLFGDLVLARKDVPASYHLAVVVDDAFQGVTLVTRGQDLLPATHAQRLLQALLGLPAPSYAHHRLILDAAGRKFSKRDGAVSLRALRTQGATPAEIFARVGL